MDRSSKKLTLQFDTLTITIDIATDSKMERGIHLSWEGSLGAYHCAVTCGQALVEAASYRDADQLAHLIATELQDGTPRPLTVAQGAELYAHVKDWILDYAPRSPLLH